MVKAIPARLSRWKNILNINLPGGCCMMYLSRRLKAGSELLK
jgi:hypothetical protein